MSAQRSVRVLLIEDNPTDILLVERALRDGTTPFTLAHAERSSKALEFLNSSPVDVVLLDLGLPPSAGLQGLLELHTCHPSVPLVVLTARDDEQLALRTVKAGAQDYLVKGRLRGDLLWRAIRYAIERNEARKVLRERTILASLTADVGLAFTKGCPLRETLQACTESLVRNLGAALARIWTLEPGENVLQLQASAGLATHLDGPHTRIEVGQRKIGRIAADKKSHLTNDLAQESCITDREWVLREGLVAFAGHPLIVEDRVVGVLGMFARRPISPGLGEGLAPVANHIALGIERSRAEEARCREEAKWQALFETSLLGVQVWTADGGLLEANETFLKMVGYTREEVTAGKVGWKSMTPPEHAHLDEQALAELRATGRSTPFEKEYVRKDGSRIPVLLGGALLPGETEKGVAYVLDLTRIKESEEAGYQLQAIVEGTDDAIIGKDLEGIILAWNPGAERLYGYRAEEVLGQSISLLVPLDRAHELRTIMERVRRGERVPPFETIRRGKDGTLLDVSVSMAPVRDRAGRVIAVSKIAHDITDKKRLEEQFRQAQKMEAVGRLAGGVAHDFNNLLTVINGFSDIVFNSLPAESSVRGLVDEIRKAGERATSLTRQLLAFSRKTVLEPRVLNLNEVVADSKKMLQRIVGEDIDITTVLAPELPNVKVDPGQIEQALVNLVVNARDAMPQGGSLTIETAEVELDALPLPSPEILKPGPYVLLAVTDTGCGMDAETRAHIFEPFFTTKEAGKGTGLGLAMVYGFVKQSEGHITVYSEKDHGTTFKIYLPPVRDRKVTGKSWPGIKRVPTGSETILLVEDDESVRAITRFTLTKAGYQVLEASHGAEAIRLAGKHEGPLHLLVTDVVMPQMNGRAVAEKIRSLKPGIKVLFLSGYTDDAVVRHGILEAEMPFLQKPFTPVGLCQKVRAVLDE